MTHRFPMTWRSVASQHLAQPRLKREPSCLVKSALTKLRDQVARVFFDLLTQSPTSLRWGMLRGTLKCHC